MPEIKRFRVTIVFEVDTQIASTPEEAKHEAMQLLGSNPHIQPVSATAEVNQRRK